MGFKSTPKGNAESKLKCALCGREEELTDHHLIPRTRHHNKRNKREFTREEVKTRKIKVCRPCHDSIHALISEKELERVYNTLESLRAHEELQKFIKWIRKKPIGFRPSSKKKRS